MNATQTAVLAATRAALEEFAADFYSWVDSEVYARYAETLRSMRVLPFGTHAVIVMVPMTDDGRVWGHAAAEALDAAASRVAETADGNGRIDTNGHRVVFVW